MTARGDLPDNIRATLDAFADLVATKVAGKVAAPQSVTSPWLTAAEAAEYLGCSVSRVRTLTLTGELPHHRDGRRPLYHRDELDHFVRAGGASCP
jgi:excisionase family DNA binding protein